MSLCSSFDRQLSQGESVYPLRIEDSLAVYFEKPRFTLHGNGMADDTAALQSAIDAAYMEHHGGIVFVPAGTYLLQDTLRIWRGVRLIGFGKRRPVFLLQSHTPGFENPSHRKHLIHFCNFKTQAPYEDANNTTFFSSLSNIDIQIMPGNKGAVAVRFHAAQHCMLEHMDFHLADCHAGIEDAGNLIEDCRFFGGSHGLDTRITSASWQTMLMDCQFSQQSRSAILTQQAGLTLIRCRFSDVPHAIQIRKNAIEELYAKDCQFENILNSVIHISRPDLAENQINVENAICLEAPVFASFESSEHEDLSINSSRYLVDEFSCGMHIENPFESERQEKIRCNIRHRGLAELPEMPEKDYPSLPPQEEWINVRALGAKGDGHTDDTEAFQNAIESNRVVYVPLGQYVISDTLELRPDTVLFGLQPNGSLLVLKRNTPGFHNRKDPKPLIVAPPEGDTFVSGLGLRLYGDNSGAIGIKWMAGPQSCMNDVFIGSWSEMLNGATWNGVQSSRWIKNQDLLYNILVCNNGGGIFKNLWTENWYSTNGFYVRDTKTPSSVYLISVEHHLECEVVLENVQNWRFYALQTEEHYRREKDEETSVNAMAIDAMNCQKLLFANLFAYRTMAQPRKFPYMMRTEKCHDFHFKGVHIYSFGKHPFENALLDKKSGCLLPNREFASLHLK